MKHHQAQLVLFTAVGWLAVWLDLALGHVSAGLKHPLMWLPLVFLPCAAGVSVATAIRASRLNQRLFGLVGYAAVLIGLVGFAFHLARLLKDLKGAVQWEVLMRLVRYPPLFAPLAVSGLGTLGLLVSRQEEER